MTQNPKIAAARPAGRRSAGLHERQQDHPLFVLDADDEHESRVGILHIHDCLRAGLG